MKKKSIRLLALLLSVLLLCSCGAKEAAVEEKPAEAPAEETAAAPEEAEASQEAEAAAEEAAEPEEEPAPVEETPVEYPKLSALTVDGGYALDFDPDLQSYVVTIPDGRPRVPQIAAEGEGEVTVYQATIADGESSGIAKAVVEADGVASEYVVEFVRDASAGFQLQYADEYAYVPSYTLKSGESFSWTSSDPSTVAVSQDGILSAKKLSETPVTITVSAGGAAVEELVVDKVIKAPLNVFLIIGQSNAYGWNDVPAGYATYYEYADEQKLLCDAPAPGTVWCDDISNGYDEYWFSGIYDLSAGRNGFSPALGKTWYELTGEKCFMLQTAIGSTPIETWVPDPELKFYGLDCYAQTVERFNYFEQQFTAADSNFEINRIYAFWLQGETGEEYAYDPGTFVWEYKNATPNYSYSGDWVPISMGNQAISAKKYYNYFMDMYNGLKQDVGLQFIGILPVRCMYSVSSAANQESQQLIDIVPTRSAQFALNGNDNDEIAIVTLETEIGRTESFPDQSAEGWGYMGCANIHYNQKGYNAIGKDAAINTVARFSAEEDHSPEYIRIVDKDGRTRLDGNGTIYLVTGEKHRVASIVLPLFSNAGSLTYTVEDEKIVKIDEYGMLTATENSGASGKSTTVTVSNGEISASFTVTIK